MQIALPLGVILISYALVAAGTQIYVRACLLPKIHASADALDRLEPRILADLKLLASDPIYLQLPRDRNSERFLSGFISWVGAGAQALNETNHDRLLDLMKSHEYAFESDDGWKALLNAGTLADTDLAWVDQLIAYDHIDLGTHPAYLDRLARVEHSHGFLRLDIAMTLPTPNFSELRFAALARVAQLQIKDRAPEALALYRHVSYLLWTTDSLNGALAAVAMLQNEKSLARRTETDWVPIDDARINAMKRTSWAWRGIERAQAHQGSLASFEPYFKRSVNACASVFDNLRSELILQDYLVPTAPFEVDLRDHLTTQRENQTKIFELCDHQNLNVFLLPVSAVDSPLMLTRRKPNPSHLPFLRRIIGLSAIAEFDTNEIETSDFRLYEENPRQAASK